MTYIKRISMFGENKPESFVDLKPGLNIFCGKSNTGKSVIVECIDFLLGKKDTLIDLGPDYQSVSMIVTTGNGDVKLTRKLNTGNIFVESTDHNILSGKYSVNSKKNPINDVVSDLFGIPKNKEIIVSKKWKTQNFTFRTCINNFIIKQEDIITRSTILLPVQIMSQPAAKSGLLYLWTGDTLEGERKENSLVRKTRRNALKNYINELLVKVDKQREDLKAKASINPEEVEKQIGETLNEIASIEQKLDADFAKNKEYTDKIISLDSSISECSSLIKKYDALETQYSADIKRLTLLVENETKSDDLKVPVRCPFCDGLLEKEEEESCAEAAQKELLRLVPQVSDLESTKEEVNKELSSLRNTRNQYESERRLILSEINDVLKPLLTELNTNLKKFRTSIEDSKEANMLLSMENEYKSKLDDLNKEPDKQEDFDVMRYYKDNEILKTLADEFATLLTECNFDSFTNVEFNEKEFDFDIDGKAKKTQGQGYRVYLNALSAIALHNCMDRNGAYSPRLLVLDSPKQSLKENVSEDMTESMKYGLYKYLVDHSNDRQTIIAENSLPTSIDYSSVNVIRFTGDENIEGRYGFIEDIRN